RARGRWRRPRFRGGTIQAVQAPHIPRSLGTIYEMEAFIISFNTLHPLAAQYPSLPGVEGAPPQRGRPIGPTRGAPEDVQKLVPA
ncbi:MAG TPA: hypothetical protein PLQ38_06955, partial [Methanothrix sp.]|nr:hypothetical protein [Methanothrix sp.]